MTNQTNLVPAKQKRPQVRRTVIAKQKRFLDSFGRTGNFTQACMDAGYSGTSTIYRLLKSDPDFKRRFDELDDRVGDMLESVAIDRAVNGVEEPVFYQGREVGGVVKYDNTLLMNLLKARNRRYKPNAAGGGTTIGIAIIPMGGSAQDWEAQAKAVHAQQLSMAEAQGSTIEYGDDDRVIEGEATVIERRA